MRAALMQLGKADSALAEKMLQMLEGLNAASSAGESDEGGSASDQE